MDPSARNFVPHPSHHHHQHQQPVAPLGAPPGSKLSAQAPPFVPGGQYGNYADPQQDSPFSKGATPYTPTNPKLASKFPATPTEQQQEEQEEDTITYPPDAPHDWTESALPKAFGCHNTAAKATSSAIPFHCQWDLYADDHDSGNTPLTPGAMSFDPVLISSVGDVASFWRLLRYIPPPSACGIPFTYSFFRHDIRPEWEHARNKKGGTITIVIFDRDRIELSDPQKLDDIFQLTLVSCVGESVSDSATTLNGVMFKCRQNKPVTLQLWTAHSDVAKLKSFGNSFRDMLARVMEAKNLQKLEYFSHQQKQADANSLASRMRSFTKPKPDCTI